MNKSIPAVHLAEKLQSTSQQETSAGLPHLAQSSFGRITIVNFTREQIQA